MVTTEKFIAKSKIIHGDKYDYSLVDYKGVKQNVKIICNIHGVFEQTPDKHYNYSGCKKCSGRHRPNNLEFINKAKVVHNDKYDYSLIDYINVKTKIKIICTNHGEFEQTPSAHLKGQGCHKCGFISRCQSSTSNNLDFINKASLVHDNKFDYSKINYNGRDIKIKIICPNHGEFEQTPHNHLKGHGCFHCMDSKGEKMVQKILVENNITFVKQKRFKDCRNLLPLPFDFYLPEHNTCIEFNGRQHYESVSKFGGEKGFQKTIKNDYIKLKYCQKNKISLLVIKHTDVISDKIKLLFPYVLMTKT